MEMPVQELPVIFSQMLQMFPNIPQDIIWMYVQQYSRDIEKCAQMLNLQSNKYSGLKSTIDTAENLNECSYLQIPKLMLQSETVVDNNNDVPLTQELPLQSTESNMQKFCMNDKQRTEQLILSSPSHSSLNDIPGHIPTASANDTNTRNNIRDFNKPLILDIVPDDDDSISHSWRPNVSADILCSDFFVPSPLSENCNLNSNLSASLNFNHDKSKVTMNPEGTNQESTIYSNNPCHMFYGYTPQNGRYENDIASYLHYQKSQMNVMRYEVIKAKIDLSNLKDCVEKLNFELKEKMQSKSVQDIEELNEEIVQLRVDCQCLCTDVDQVLNDQGLLGDVDERCYLENKSSSNSAAIQNKTPQENITADILDDSNRWQCPKCTFANHSAICVCEMCSAPRPSRQEPPFLQSRSSSCYCHPNEKSLSVQS